jgi:hypothetical protein
MRFGLFEWKWDSYYRWIFTEMSVRAKQNLACKSLWGEVKSVEWQTKWQIEEIVPVRN